ncbi:MAG: heat-shock protein [Candidatus Syntrophoarchaeum caldarius]|uniref:Heat-shock protein n=1 Tax=Candidatus Syntropharchaeum caldarium TaxID=1838285 RepID=A0A1F2PDE2_9EURY|nr:MAG: heat-shock protein [Candidatus Syntrophoarchaeum caldarius]
MLALLMVTIAFGIRAIAMGRMPIPTHYLLLTLAITFVIGTAILNQEEDLNTIVGGGIFAVIVSFIVLSLIGGVISIFEDPPSFNLLLSAVSVCIIVSAIMLRVFTGFTSA